MHSPPNLVSSKSVAGKWNLDMKGWITVRMRVRIRIRFKDQDQGSRIKDQGLQKGRKTERCSDIGKMLQRQVHHGKGKQTRCNAMGAEKRKKTDRRSKTTIVVKASLVTTNFSCRIYI